jgi:hypothetical protein
MAVEIINDKALWDGFIEESPYGMLFHRWDLLKVIEKHIGYDLLTYGIYDGKELVGILPMFYTKTKGVKLLYSPPQGTLVYIPYMGLVMSRAYDGFTPLKKERCLAMAWGDIGRELNRLSPNFTSLTFVPNINDIRPFVWDGYDIEVMYTYLIDLDMPVDAIWNGFDRECKNNIKKAAQCGLSIKHTTDVDKFYDIMSKGLQSQGNTFFQRQSPEYLKDLLAAFPKNITMNFLYKDGEVIGAKLDCNYKGLYMGWGGDSVVNREIKANEYLEWETIKMAKESGNKWYENWGGDMKRLSMFKSKFNPSLVPYYHITKKDPVGKLSDWGYGMISSKPYLGFMKKIIT